MLEQHLLTLGGLGCPGGVLLQVRWALCMISECCTADFADNRRGKPIHNKLVRTRLVVWGQS